MKATSKPADRSSKTKKTSHKQSSKNGPLPRAEAWLDRHIRPLTFTGGSAIVLLWTFYRHITNGVNFDVVGQIGLAQQWANGQIDGAQLGTTNYVLKIPFYLLVNQLHALSPMNRILLLAAAFNLVTFAGIFYIYGRLLILYNAQNRTWLYIALLWLTTIMGNVYWMDYANSRNLETFGGILFTYGVLRFIRKQDWWIPPIIATVGSVVFFADVLQFYVCGIGAVIFVIGGALQRRTIRHTIIAFITVVMTGAGYAGARGISLLCTRYLNVSFLHAPSTKPDISIAGLISILQSFIVNTCKIFGANFAQPPFGISTIRTTLNAIVLISLLGLLIRFWPKIIHYTAAKLALIIIAVNYVVYAASGQSAGWETYRYLLMIPLFTVMIISVASSQLHSKYERRLKYAWLTLSALSVVMLAGALVVSWPTRHVKDAHIDTVISFMKQHHYGYAVSSREIGVTTTYFAQSSVTALPFGCGPDHLLHPTNLFYDNEAFEKLYDYKGQVPIILQNGAITFGANTCNRDDVIGQFGIPSQEIDIPNVGTAMVYDAASLRIPDIDTLVGHPRHDDTAAIASVADKSNLTTLENCDNGTFDVIVAHPDDDILFMNPDLRDAINAGSCVRSIYVTAADDGRQQSYWQKREQGIEAAYAVMAGVEDVWHDQPAIVDGHKIMTRSLESSPSISLVFLRLPDGGVQGEGFSLTGHSSLKSLAANGDLVETSVDKTASYTYKGLTRVVRVLFYKDKPTKIFTTIPGGQLSIGDHSDHSAVGRIAVRAASMVKSTATINEYVGYPNNGKPANLSDTTSEYKRALFDVYAHDDAAICPPDHSCTIDGTYDKYFSRQYKIEQSVPKQVEPLMQQTPSAKPQKSSSAVLNLLEKKSATGAPYNR